MTLESIYYIGQTVAVIAIVVSLIFVGLQVRMAYEQTRQSNELARQETSRTNIITFITEQQRLFATPEDAACMH